MNLKELVDCDLGQIFLKVWRTATLQPFNLQTLYLQY